MVWTILALTTTLSTGCHKIQVLERIVVKTVEDQAFTEAEIGDLAEAVLNDDKEKIKAVVLKARGKSLDIQKSLPKIKEELAKGWFMGLFAGVLDFVTGNGGVLVEAGKNIITQNWGGLVMGLVAGGLEWARRKEKGKKNVFASVVNDIAHEPDEKVRKEKAKNVFVKVNKTV
jgi:hypothetical protein